MSVLGYRTNRPSSNYGNRQRGNGPKKTFLNNWKPTVVGEWVQFRAGEYGNCEACGGSVVATEANYGYKCTNLIYENNRPKGGGPSSPPARCGHTGNLEAGKVRPYAVNYNSFIPTGGRGNGAYVQSNSFNGGRQVPDLLYHYAQQDETIKISQHFAHMVVLGGKFHQIEKESATGNKYTVDEPCVGRGCDGCANNRPSTNGSLRVYNPGWNHWNNLISFAENIAECCVSCREGYIVPTMYLCPECGSTIHDLAESDFTERLSVFRNICLEMGAKGGDGLIGCGTCNARVVPIETSECLKLTFDRRNEFVENAVLGCDNPVRMTIFDCAVKISKTSAENTSDLKLDQFDRMSFLTEDDLARFPVNDFMDLTDVTPARQAEQMRKPNVFYDSQPRGATGAAGAASSNQPAGTTRRGGSVNYGR